MSHLNHTGTQQLKYATQVSGILAADNILTSFENIVCKTHESWNLIIMLTINQINQKNGYKRLGDDLMY